MRLIQVAKDAYAVIAREIDTDQETMIGVHSPDDSLQKLFASRANGTTNEEGHEDPTKRHKKP